MNNVKAGRWHQSQGQIQQIQVFMGKVTLEHWGKHVAGGSRVLWQLLWRVAKGKHRQSKWLEVIF